MTPKPGQIWYGFTDSGEKKRVVVVSREEMNRGAYATIVPITSKKFELRKNLPNCVSLAAGTFGLITDSVAQAENVSLIGHSDLDFETGPIAELDVAALRTLIKAIGYVIGSDCELL